MGNDVPISFRTVSLRLFSSLDRSASSDSVGTYEQGDYVKVEFPDETTGIAEWMWVRVHHCDDEKKLVFGSLVQDVKPSL